MSWPGFTRNDGRSTSLAVDEDVAVHDHLAGLGRGAGEAGTQHEGVETHLEQLDQVLTGQARALRRASSNAMRICFSRMPYWARRRCFSRRRTA